MTTDALLSDLARVAGAVGRASEPPGADRLLTTLAETARRVFGAQACSLALVSEDGAELVYTTAAGAGSAAVTGLRLPASRGIAGWVVQSGQPVAVSDVSSDPRFAPDVAASTGYTPRAILAAPVVSEQEVLGVLTVLDRDAGRPGGDEDMLLLQVFCEQAAIALEGARAFRRITTALLDALASAAGSGSALADHLAQAAEAAAPEDVELTELAALLARVSRRGSEERRLAVDLVGKVMAFLERREASRPGV